MAEGNLKPEGGIRLKLESILSWVIPDSEIMNQNSIQVYNSEDKQYQVCRQAVLYKNFLNKSLYVYSNSSEKAEIKKYEGEIIQM